MSSKITSSEIRKYLKKRFSDEDFHKALTKASIEHVKLVSTMKFGEVIDYNLGKKFIQQLDFALVEQDALIKLAQAQMETLESYFEKNDMNLADVVDKKVMSKIDELFGESIVLSKHAEVFVSKIMHSEFMANLFTDALYITIINFYKKVNPLFGGLATKIIEKQVRVFIQKFIHIVLDQMTNFVVSSKNQEIFTDFLKTLTHLVLEEPVIHYFEEVSSKQRKRFITVVEQLAQSKPFEKFSREITMTIYDSLYNSIKNDPIGKYADLEKGAKEWGFEIAKAVIPMLHEDTLLDFIEAEFKLAHTELD